MTTQNGSGSRAVAIAPDDVGRSLLSQLPKAQIEVLRKTVAPGASDAELEHFLAVAQHNHLDPIADPVEVWMIPRKSQVNGQWVTKYQTMTSKDGALKAAKASGRYRTHSIEYREGDGQWYPDGDEPDMDAAPVACRCTIPVAGWDQPIRFVARWREYCQFKDGRPTEMWSKYGRMMLAKCALKNALKLLPSALDGVEMDDGGDFEPTRVAQGAFWAWADAEGISEQTVRRCLQVTDGQSLGAAVERMGGWNAARTYVEAYAPSFAQLPAPTVSAADALYGDDQHRDPLGHSADAAAREPEMFMCSACGRRTDEVRVRAAGGSVCKYCWEIDQDKADMKAEMPAAAERAASLAALGLPPEAPAAPEVDAQQLPCWQCGAVLATRELNGEPACETCFIEAQEQAAAAEAATPMPAGLAIPAAISVPVELEPSVASMIAALKLHCDLTEAEARLRMNRLGPIRLNAQTPREVLAELWAKVSAE